ncbi:MAG: D-alanyl-D-alanine carboxypeptidase family protein [Anaerovoracaceae bacterium]|jgi:D-alanyl-D-alanine carboxypeptidase (penicillin-binding protein 5/6)
MKKTFILLLTLCFVIGSVNVSWATEKELSLVGQSAILIDANTGKVLYEKNSRKQHYPASTTKIMTAILTLENLELSDPVTIDSETSFTEGSRIYLLEGEKVTVKEVLYGLLLESANDSAVALAKEISGTVEEFAKLMNQKAVKLGAKNTHFVNPNGLHEDDHLTTAYDLAMIAKYAMKNKTFRDFVSTYQYTMPATNLQETRYFYNTNRLLYDDLHSVPVNGVNRPCKYKGVTGIKTGYTGKAGGCLVASAKRGNTELIAVTLASTDMGRFADCITLLDYGFENYKTISTLACGQELGTIPVKRGAVRKVPISVSEDACATLPLEASEKLIRTEVDLYKNLKAPVEIGQKAGVVKVFMGDQLLGEYDAIATKTIKKGGFLSLFGIPESASKIVEKIIFYTFCILLLLSFLYIIIKRRQIKKKKLLRQHQREKLRRLNDRDKARWQEEYWNTRQY